MDDLKEELKTGLQNDLKAVSTPKDWLSFDKMIAPVIIKILFWIGAVAAVIAGLVLIIQAIGAGSLPGFFSGLLVIVLGPIMWLILDEIWLELRS